VAFLNLSDIRKAFAHFEIIHGIDLEVEEGEFVALVGPSGCGKSTLLRMIAGLENTSGGSIVLDGRDVTQAAPKHRDIAMVFQNYALYPHMTVAENMSFSLRLAGASKEARKAAARDVAEILGLEDLLERYPRQLSGGQRQRVAMGRAIVRKPKVFLFDEPLSNLDAKLRVQMRAEIKALHQRLKITTVYVTHDQIEAMTLADRIVVLRDGRIEQSGAPLALYDDPANTFVAGFIGSPAMNFFDGVCDGDTISTNAGTVLCQAATGLPSGRKVIVGVRPEHIRLDGGPARVTVSVVEPSGSHTQIHAKLDDTDLTISVEGRVGLAPGDKCNVTFPREATFYFDPNSQLRIAA